MVAPLGRRSGRKKFTGKKQDLFESVNIRNCGQLNVRKHKDIKNSDERVTISEEFENLDKMETTYSESKVKMEGSGKWLVTALALKTKARSKKYKIGKVCHRKCQYEGPFQQNQRV